MKSATARASRRCPTCNKVMGPRVRRCLAPRVPVDFGPNRRAALEESQDGWCACCDELPIPNRKGAHRFTCGREECKAAWRHLCSLDWHARKRAEKKGRAA